MCASAANCRYLPNLTLEMRLLIFSLLTLFEGAYFYKAKKITAVEFDEDCKDNFIENIRINNVPMDAIDLLMIDALKHNNFNYDIILANINKNIIKELIPKFKDSKAMVLLSGILVKDRQEIISLLSLNNLKLLFEDKYNEWLFMAVKNA